MSRGRNTKFVVVLGYVLMVALAVFGIIWIYLELLNFSKVAENPRQQKELVVLSSTLATMYQAEGTVGLLAVATDPTLSLEYDSLMTAVFYQVDSLKNISSDSYLNEHLDSLNLLLQKKQENIKALVDLNNSLERTTTREITKTTILTQKNQDYLDNLLDSLLINRVNQIEDTTLIVGEKKGFFRRIGDAIKSSQPDTLRQISSSASITTEDAIIPLLRDTIVDFIQEINQMAQKKNAAIINQLVKQQNELYAVNEKTTSQINMIMNELEAKEHANTLRVIEEQTHTIERSSKVVAIIALAAIIIAIFFMSWIIRSITIGQRLQKEIEAEKKNVERLLASREQLMMTITHDIKAPISSIMGYLELMMKDKPSSKDAYYIENMQHSALHILNLVKNLLDFHSLDVNQQKTEQLPFSPFILIRDIYESFVPVAKKKDLLVDSVIDIDKDENYQTDPYRIRQIVNNIFSNAIKFTPAKGVVSLFATLSKAKNKTSLIISIKDTGPGIKDEDKDSVFEEFKRLDYSGTGIEGSGLGLNISAKLARLLGGSIDLKSSLGKGSVFTITIPLYPIIPSDTLEKKKSIKIPTPAEKPPAMSMSMSMECLDRSQLKILFIDDDIVHLNLLSELLKREGIIPYTCSGSLEALELLQREHFDLIFSDIQMPDMNGFELLERIRMSDFDGSVTIPIVGLSANSHLSESKYREAGFCEFLAKPFAPEQLFEIIYKYTGKGNIAINDVRPNERNGFASLLSFAGDDPEAEKSIIQSFIDENQKNVALLVQAFDNDDWLGVKKIAHKMRPLMRMVSAQKLALILEDYEKGNQSKENKPLLIELIQEKIRDAENYFN